MFDLLDSGTLALLRGLIGAEVRRARVALAFDQEDLASLVGISPSYLSQIENGREVPLSTLKRIARALELPLSALLLDAKNGGTVDAFIDVLVDAARLVERLEPEASAVSSSVPAYVRDVKNSHAAAGRFIARKRAKTPAHI
jgi:transcriptional regulator with XRE-family HTH domain